MRTRGTGRAARLAWTLCILSLALVAGSIVLWFLNDFSVRELVADNSHVGDALVALTFPLVGALIVSRRPGNPVGWLFCVAGTAEALTEFATSYSVFALLSSPRLAGGELAAWLGGVAWIPSVSLIVFLMLLFPSGTLPSERWRWGTRLAGFGIVLTTVAFALHPHTELPQEGLRVENPVAIPSLKDALELALLLGGALILGSMVAGLVALVLRYRRSRGHERLQLKWFTYSAALIVVLVLSTINIPSGVLLGTVQAVLIGPALAVATGVAMLRHRLYDIDVVINRTLVYALLTATLGAVYVGSVLLLQLGLDPLTADSSLAVAVSTLAVAALFRPARARIQGVVDRRFYRRKYDAARTLEHFSARLREQVDLDALGGELRSVVDETMQPAHVSLWLRAPGAVR
jgi:MFS family permease